ncbi:MAG TPA: carboxypeptidase-like regulatory domain-containing protein [Thermoanaerobaculia bacterium]|nr:carboxypeptidase-like regulatory domain-containing protein [Thermoanaerobaculia bacterium]
MRRAPLLILTLLTAAVTAEELKLPDPATGVINGKPAVSIWPATLRADGHPGALLPLAGCQVHHALWDDPTKKLLYPCGKWFVPPKGRYYEWMEQGDTIAAAQSQLLATGIGSLGFVGTVPMVPAGYIALTDGHGLTDELTVRYIHLTRSWRAFTRFERGSVAGTPVRMQHGPVFGAILDRKTNDAVALIRRVEIAGGKTTRVAAEKPKAGLSAVFVELSSAMRREDITLTLQIDGQAHPPDIFMDVGRRVYGVWYGVQGRTGQLAVGSKTVMLQANPVALRPGKVTTVRGELVPRPAIGVSVNMHGEATPPEMYVDVYPAGGTERLNRAPVQPAEPLRIDGLDPSAYRVVLEINRWRFRANADLTNGEDAQITWDLAPLHIEGTIHVGDHPTPARVTFMDDEYEWIETRSDELGRYRTLLWLPRDYIVRVHAEGQAAPFTELIEVLDSGTFDFTLPATRYAARVRNATTGEPIAGAEVVLNNTWESDAFGRRNVVQDVRTGETGEATLPPLRTGILEFSVRAKGFRPSGDVTHAVRDGSSETFEVALQPDEETRSLRLLLPDGVPAAKAEVLATSPTGDEIVWRSEAGDDGTVEVPRLNPGTLVVARHPSAAGIARVWNQGAETTWSLAPSGGSVTLRVERAAGEPAASAQILMFVGETRVRGNALAFLAWAAPVADRNGLWTARNLPREPLRVLAARRGDPAAMVSGTFDALAIDAPDPLPTHWTVRTID